MSKKYGYVRVSTKDQNIDRQVASLKKEQIPQKNIFIERISGKNFNRPQYRALLKSLRSGDELYIKSIDRLGRNYKEIIEQWQYLTKSKEVNVIILDFPLLDTRKQVHGITGQFIADLVLQVLSYVAQIERENTLQRQKEGIYEAQKRGVRFGRPKLDLPEDFETVMHLWCSHQISQREAARRLNTNHNTFSRWVKQYGEQKKLR